MKGEARPLACPRCARQYPLEERFCADCGMPLVYVGRGEEQPITEAHERAAAVDGRDKNVRLVVRINGNGFDRADLNVAEVAACAISGQINIAGVGDRPLSLLDPDGCVEQVDRQHHSLFKSLKRQRPALFQGDRYKATKSSRGVVVKQRAP